MPTRHNRGFWLATASCATTDERRASVEVTLGHRWGDTAVTVGGLPEGGSWHVMLPSSRGLGELGGGGKGESGKGDERRGKCEMGNEQWEMEVEGNWQRGKRG